MGGTMSKQIKPALTCLHCGHLWTARVAHPKECPQCKCRGWSTAPVAAPSPLPAPPPSAFGVEERAGVKVACKWAGKVLGLFSGGFGSDESLYESAPECQPTAAARPSGQQTPSAEIEDSDESVSSPGHRPPTRFAGYGLCRVDYTSS